MRSCVIGFCDRLKKITVFSIGKNGEISLHPIYTIQEIVDFQLNVERYFI